MNFTREIKRELTKKTPQQESGMLALLSGILAAGGEIRRNAGGGFSFTGENEEIASYLINFVEQTFGVQMSLSEVAWDRRHKTAKLTFSYFGARGEELVKKIEACDLAPTEEENYGENYLRGAFLGCGSCTLPKGGTKTGYHLEVVFERESDAEHFCETMERFQIIGNIIARNERFVAYLKSREAISDFLAVIGADGALKTLEEVSSLREERNNENRKSNCYASNADKAAIASAEQVLAFEKMKAAGRFASLPDPLRETAQARLDYPELALSELALRLSVTKSGLAHRLRKLMEIYRTEVKR